MALICTLLDNSWNCLVESLNVGLGQAILGVDDLGNKYSSIRIAGNTFVD